MTLPEIFQRFAGRRKGRPLHQGRADALKQIDAFTIAREAAQKNILNPQDFFPEPQEKIWLEIGFGNGEHLIGQAEKHPAIGSIGCEPFVNGVSAAAKDIVEKQLRNIRLWPDEALAFAAKFPDRSIDRIFLLFSDPWPKTRAHKRRVIQKESVALFARLLKPGGELRLATDHRHLAEWMLLHVAADPAFAWRRFADGEWTQQPADWIETRYQQKAARQGRHAYFMDFEKAA